MMEHDEKGNRLGKVLRKIIAIVVVMAFMVPLLSPSVFAETPITIIGGESVKGGETFTVAVTFGNGSVGRVDAQMLYDTDKLTYISGGSSSGNTGYIQMKSAGTEGSITFNIEFQALTEGEAALEVTTNEMYDLDEMYLDTPSATKTVTISGSAEQEELITEGTSDDESVEVTELAGVDEKTPEEEMEEMADENASEDSSGFDMTFIVSAAVLVILILIISARLARKKSK